VVITHGTDTLEETAFFLQLMNKHKKAIVLTGAMRPANAVSADGLKNIYNAVVLASHPKAKHLGVLVTMNDEIHHAYMITKSHANALNSFHSPGTGMLGSMNQETAQFYRTPSIEGWKSSSSAAQLLHWPRVEILYGYVGTGAFLVDDCVAHGCQAIVSAGVGMGYQSESTTQALIRARQAGVHVVRCSRVPGGRLRYEASDKERGFIVSSLMNPQKTRILCALALLQTQDVEQLQSIFNKFTCNIDHANPLGS
jgi:L-asparaginase